MFYWVFLGLGALVFLGGIVRLGRDAVHRPGLARDLLAAAILVPVALFAVYPYLGDNLVGAGDSYYYTLQIADFITQRGRA